MKNKLKIILIFYVMYLYMPSYSQRVEKISNHEFYSQDERWLLDYDYIYPVNNSEFYNPRDKDYILVHN